MNNFQILCGIAESISLTKKFTIIINQIENDLYEVNICQKLIVCISIFKGNFNDTKNLLLILKNSK